MKALAPSLLASTLLGSCATTDLGQRNVGETVTDTSTVAASLDVQSEKAEAEMRRAGVRVRDPALEAWVQGLTDHLAGEYAGEVRTYILEAPVFNAFMMPNGAMGVNTGLLLRAESEDELALVLGHEFGHYLEKHSEERFAAMSNTNTLLTFVSLAGAGLGRATGAWVDTSNIALIAVGGYYSFNREQELEADAIGIARVIETGMASSESVGLWANLNAEKESSSIKANRKRRTHSRLYDTHPTSVQRLAILKERAGVVGEIPRAGVPARSAYRARIRPHLSDWLEAEIEMRDPGATLHLIDRLEALGEDLGTLAYARAQVINIALSDRKQQRRDKYTRRMVEDFSPELVLAILEDATQFDDVPSVAYRDLGDLYAKAGRRSDAAQAFRDYLRVAPTAPDTALIRALITDMETQR